MKKLTLFIGNCVIESYPIISTTILTLSKILNKYAKEIDWYFKVSWDKANRSEISSYRGVDFESGIEWFKRIKQDFGVKIITDVHEVGQAHDLSRYIDIFQIPAFLCRQTDLLLDVAKEKKPVNIKKGQFMSVEDMQHVINKIYDIGDNIYITDRGNCFGYNDLVLDFRNIVKAQTVLIGHPRFIFDVSHGATNSFYTESLALGAVAGGVEGLFIETHPVPEYAKCDGKSSLRLEKVEPLIDKIIKVMEAIK